MTSPDIIRTTFHIDSKDRVFLDIWSIKVDDLTVDVYHAASGDQITLPRSVVELIGKNYLLSKEGPGPA